MKKTVYYTPYNTEWYSDKSFNPIIRQTELIDKTYSYANCPVFNHQSNRTFVLLSPIDFSFSIKKIEYTINPIGFDSITKIFPKINIHNPLQRDFLQYTLEDLESPLPVFQLKIPKFLFWTYEDDVWLNLFDHPITSYSNNLIAVGGWFNLSNWTRTSSFAFTVIDEDKPITIKKGDPICRLSFIYPNLNEGIILKEEKDREKIMKIEESYHEKQTNFREKNPLWKRKLFSKTNSKSKCPVGFLFK
jgi:hypothetical protein|tara:strand:- start:6 stop:743 length:738 start_codon:yes stop_codon:yes gene_type:complete